MSVTMTPFSPPTCRMPTPRTVTVEGVMSTRFLPDALHRSATTRGRRLAAGALVALMTFAPLSACTSATTTSPSTTSTSVAAATAQFSLTLADGTFTVAGAAADDTAKADAVAAVTAGLGAGVQVSDRLNVVAGAWLPDAAALTTLASSLVGVEAVSLNVNGADAVLAGTVTSDAEKQAAAAAVTTAFPGTNLTDNVSVVPLCDVIGAKVREASQAPALVFSSGSAELTTESQAAVTEIAGLVAQCPGTKLTVVGQTDTRGSEVGNEALALRRAQAVADALAEAGVSTEDMIVQGNAANATISDDDSLNRRVDVAVQ